MKRLLLIPILSLMLWSCSKSDEMINDGGDVDGSTPITISVDSESLTRGTVAETEAAMGSVGLYCAYTAQEDWTTSTEFDKMSGEKFTYDNSKLSWEYDEANVGEQPTWGHTSITDKYTFYAYSPHSTDANSSITPTVESGALQIAYSVPTSYDQQKDLLVATPRKNIYPQAGGKAKMSFSHALVKVSFSVKGDATRKVTSITLKGLQNSGTLTFASDGTFSWSNNTATESFTVSESGGLKDNVTTDDETSQNITTNNGYLFMLPQDASGKEVEVTVANADGSNSEVTTLTIPDNQIWVAGGAYDYTIGVEEEVFVYFYEQNTGTESDPFVIENTFDLETLRNVVNNDKHITIKGESTEKSTDGFYGYYFRMSRNIDLSVTHKFCAETPYAHIPIGSYDFCFKGIFDGENHSISNLYLDNPTDDYQAFFGCAQMVTIKNLTIESGKVEGKEYVAGLVAYIPMIYKQSSYIVNCHNKAEIIGDRYIGGIAARADGYDYYSTYKPVYITSCSNMANISDATSPDENSSDNFSTAGGIVGDASDVIMTDCNNISGNIIGSQVIGGVVGTASSSIITNCNNYGNEVYGYGVVGGISGSAISSTKFYDCSNVASMVGLDRVGGITGSLSGSSSDDDNPAEIVNCVNSGTVSGYPSLADYSDNLNYYSFIGGICGISTYYSVISDCVNEKGADVSALASCAGGIVGTVYEGLIIKNCINRANVSAYSRVGGLFGYIAFSYNPNMKDNEIYVLNNCNVGETITGAAGGVGGLLGDNYYLSDKVDLYVYNCYNVANIIYNGTGTLCGPLFGGPMYIKWNSDCYYLEGSCTDYNPGYTKGGTEMTDEDMKNSEFVDLLNENAKDNFSKKGLSTWVQDTDNSNRGYPELVYIPEE